jgi:hypothetical protein
MLDQNIGRPSLNELGTLGHQQLIERGDTMHGVVLVPNSRRDILWLNSIYEMNCTNWNDVVGHWANPPFSSSSDAPTAGAYVNLGGIFASPPVAVAVSESRLDVFGLGTDYAVYHKTFDASITDPASQWTPAWERLGGNFMSTPAVVSTGAQQIDVFGLGIDQGMVHSSWNGIAWSDWDELGGCFSSPPVVLPTATGTFDIFARAIDYKLYHLAYDPTTQTDWKILGGGLLGEPVAAVVCGCCEGGPCAGFSGFPGSSFFMGLTRGAARPAAVSVLFLRCGPWAVLRSLFCRP